MRLAFGDIFPGIALIIFGRGASAAGAGSASAIIFARKRYAIAAFLGRLCSGRKDRVNVQRRAFVAQRLAPRPEFFQLVSAAGHGVEIEPAAAATPCSSLRLEIP